MATAIGVATSSHSESFMAGREAAEASRRQIASQKTDLVLVFATVGYDQKELLKGVREVYGDTPLSGCSGEGIITQLGSDEGTYAVGVMAIASDQMTFKTFQVKRLKDQAKTAALLLSEQVKPHLKEGGLLLLFPDGLTANLTALLAGLNEHLPSSLKIVGGTSGDNLRFTKTYQYHNGDAESDSLSAVLIDGNLAFEMAVGHGCELIGIEMEITRSKGNQVEEIDGVPALSVYRDYVQKEDQDVETLAITHLCLGEKIPATARSDYGEHLIRAPLGIDEARGALHFAVELPVGTRVQLARRNSAHIRENCKILAEKLVSLRPHQSPLAVLQFDCAGRGRVLFGEKVTEMVVDPIQNRLGKSIPWLGFHTFGEIMPLSREGATFFHNYTVALCALYEK